MMVTGTTHEATSRAGDTTGLRGFMNQGGFWRYLLFLVAYLAIYLCSGLALGKLAPDLAEADLLSSVGSVFVQVTFGLVVGGVVLFAMAHYLGWTRELFGRQPIYRSRWMWLGPVVALVPVTLRVLGIDWGRNTLPVVAAVLLSGLLVGVVEELMYRGFAVRMVRSGGHGERAVAALAALAFALSHSVNLLSGQALATVAFTVFYTFGFGVLMYLTLRVTGFLVWVMLVHGLTDPTTILASGGIDKVASGGSSSGLLTAAGLVTIPLALVGIVSLLFVRGRVGETESEPDGMDVPA
jgi:uncharacterized protein